MEPEEFEKTDNLPACAFPLVHLNGTGREALLAEYKVANDAFNNFCNVLGKVTMHARDYYPIGEGAFAGAKETREAVFSLCDEIGAYLEDHIKHLSEGQ